MKELGNKKTFGIYCDPYLVQYKDDPDAIARPEAYEEWASVYFWVNEKNLFEYRDFGPDATYSYDISILVEFFCRNLFFHITTDPFPAATKAIVAVDKMNETNLVEAPDDDINKWAEIDWDNVDMELHGNIDLWNHHHGLLTNRGGSFLPHLFICKVDAQIEISWQNDFPYNAGKGDIFFKYEKGVEYIDIKLYRDTVVAFCLDYLNQFKDKYPEALKEQRAELQKAMDVVL